MNESMMFEQWQQHPQASRRIRSAAFPIAVSSVRGIEQRSGLRLREPEGFAPGFESGGGHLLTFFFTNGKITKLLEPCVLTLRLITQPLISRTAKDVVGESAPQLSALSSILIPLNSPPPVCATNATGPAVVFKAFASRIFSAHSIIFSALNRSLAKCCFFRHLKISMCCFDKPIYKRDSRISQQEKRYSRIYFITI